ncbi:2-polyprenyl-6-methoxyphenol hydroxylase-like FAD-dependent oxidoreductase [Microbacterium endophyticum]|uniref:2-polyprenyl-6-methoxyphenol hydroxylase-like FAD-dependent oxidoreductase n=1 Tax=Microbacterium endophyticum TaxID=1526412 RepID=A0A7W4YN40_9MICO|nr:NAD(P)/FAD-dependent oxidoreductase [Microbacterium endophyticum]MBB2976838.1 2-polyprenyl-6-methoxyphenol hydroxylase-like FAD-dependent oxidoreductase [Microbacterium endophyticum]NIK35844.1 2-polyprenyl-6-methoxyphenol hydroxylase-like FAD-dependent oxidoreductase [Microbacterium endophyticum]
MYDVIVVGAGPVGMVLAMELARHGVGVQILEQRPEPGTGTRAIGVHPPVLAALEPSGVTDALLSHALRVTRGEARSDNDLLGTVRFDRLTTRFPFVATLPQAATETALRDAAPLPRRGVTVTGVRPDGPRVRVEISDGAGLAETLYARIVVVASGWAGRALVYRADRLAAHSYPDRYLMTDSEASLDADENTAIVNLSRGGVLESFPLPHGLRRYVAWDAAGAATRTENKADANARRLREAMVTRGEARAAAHVTAATTFEVRRFVAPQLRHDRIFAIGDVAHEVSPIGGQGMNLGILDAVGLAPLLAWWVQRGVTPDPQLRAWESRRVNSARIAATLAAANTRLGRGLSRSGDAARSGIVRAMLRRPTGAAFAKAYAMGFDRDAADSRLRGERSA